MRNILHKPYGIIMCVAAVPLLLLSACKKDKLKLQEVTRIESNTTSRLNKVTCFGNGVCIIAGGERFYKAEVLRSENAGSSWSNKEFPEAGKGMYGLAVSPSGNVYLSGFDGKILVSADQGQNWSFRQMWLWKFYLDATALSDNEYLFVSTNAYNYGTLVRTDSNLQVIDTAYLKFGLNDVDMINSNTGYLAGYGAVLKTTDGGRNWAYMDVKNDNFMAAHSISATHTWICGYRGSIFRTTNGGQSWEKLRNGNNLVKKHYLLLDICFRDEKTGWACGEKGLLIRTTDGGDTWQEYESFTSEALRDMAFAADGSMLVVGDNGTIFKLRVD